MRDRSTVEIIVLALTVTACAVILIGGITVAVIEIRDPAADTSTASGWLGAITGAMIAALLGLIAGRAGR